MLRIEPRQAEQLTNWLNNHNGIQVWRSRMIGSGRSFMTANDETTRPNWECGQTPDEIITSTEEIEVISYREVKRFHVGLRRGSGMSIDLTPAAAKRVKREIEKAGEGASYKFDYEHQDAVILVPDKIVTLKEYNETRTGI